MIDETFAPKYDSGQTITTGASSPITYSKGLGSKSLVLTNLGSEVVYVRISNDTGLAATIADYPILPLTQVSISKFEDDAVLDTFSAAAGSLHVMAGEGY